MPAISALITVLIIERPMCVECIAERAQVGLPAVRDRLDAMDKLVTVLRGENDRCRACGRIGKTFSLARKD